MCANITPHKETDLEGFWNHIFEIKNGTNQPMFPLLPTFIAPLLAVPHSSATAERIFSSLNLIKTKYGINEIQLPSKQ